MSSDVEAIDLDDDEGNVQSPKATTAPSPGGQAAETPHLALLTVKICQPSHEFTFGVGISFIPYTLVLTPVV
jgi:hypothetical protein